MNGHYMNEHHEILLFNQGYVLALDNLKDAISKGEVKDLSDLNKWINEHEA